jgi:hypothetical protein
MAEATSEWFETDAVGANPHSGAFKNCPEYAKNATDLEADFVFTLAYDERDEGISHTRNNWFCYDFKKKTIMPIRSFNAGPGYSYLKLWLVEMSADGEDWRELDH